LIIVASGRLAGVATTVANAFLCQMGEERPSLPVVALNQDAGLATIFAQSAAFKQYFSCQIQAQANADDCVLLLDCDASPAMVAAVQVAREVGCSTMVITRGDGQAWEKESPDRIMSMMSPTHVCGVEAILFFCQLLCQLVESELFGFE
jgi:D-sedoheptulose 7-phosphate isomerase